MSRVDYRISEVDPASWDALVGQFEDRTVFHTLPWLETIRAAHGVKIVLTQAQVNDRCVAIWPYLELRKGPLRVIGSPLPGWSTAYMGPLFDHKADIPAVLQAFLEHRLFRRYAFFACKSINRSHPVDLGAFGFKPRMLFDTYMVDLTLPEETLWSNLKSECRTRIRKAGKLNMEVRWETNVADFIDDFWQMSLETFAKARIAPTHTRTFAVEVWKRLSAIGRIKAVSAWHEGQRTAMLVLPFDDRRMYYWGGASFDAFRSLPGHNLLHWEAICKAKAMGLQEYDFISTSGGPGRFKKTFGPTEVAMATHWERSSSRLMAVLKNQYESYLRKRRRVNA